MPKPSRNPGQGEPHWRDLPPLPTGPRVDLACGVVKDAGTGQPVEIVAVGGRAEGFDRLEVDIYDIQTHQWRVGGEMGIMKLNL